MNAQQILRAKYGDPLVPNFDEKFTVLWDPTAEGHAWWSWGAFRVNKDFQAMLDPAFTALEKQNLQGEITHFNGCENHRHIAGSAAISTHSWASAIDLNADLNPQVRKPQNKITAADRQGKWSAAFIKCFTDQGITFGGNFKRVPDPMHFAQVDG